MKPDGVCHADFLVKTPNKPMSYSHETKGWHSRGYLPHFDGGESTQFITFRLSDSVPQKLIDKWRSELKHEKVVILKLPCVGELNFT